MEATLWTAGIAITILAAQGTLLRWVIVRLREDRESSHQRDAELHHRINEVKDGYVRRDDLMAHIGRLETGQADMNSGINRLHDRMDRLITATATGRAEPATKGI